MMLPNGAPPPNADQSHYLFVLAGSTCHYFAVLFYVAQPRT